MKRSSRLLVPILAWVAGCATASDRPPQPIPPPSSGELGYREAVALGTQFIAERGYSDAQLEGAEQLHANIWRVRFGKGSDGVLHLYFDGLQKTLIKAEEIQGVRGRPTTLPLIPPPKKP